MDSYWMKEQESAIVSTWNAYTFLRSFVYVAL